MTPRCLLPLEMPDVEHLATCDAAVLAQAIRRMAAHPVGRFAVWLALQEHPQGHVIWNRIRQAEGSP